MVLEKVYLLQISLGSDFHLPSHRTCFTPILATYFQGPIRYFVKIQDKFSAKGENKYTNWPLTIVFLRYFDVIALRIKKQFSSFKMFQRKLQITQELPLFILSQINNLLNSNLHKPTKKKYRDLDLTILQCDGFSRSLII